MNWLLLSCLASFVIALGIGLALYLNWKADQAELFAEQERDAVFAALWGDQHPHGVS